jgi:hypothetical protein
MGEIVSVDQVVGRDLFAVENDIPIKRLPFADSTTVRTVNQPDRLGAVFSYVERNGLIWWMLNPEGTEWVLHKKGRFNLDLLKQQGTKSETDIQREKELASASMLEKLFLTAKYKFFDNKTEITRTASLAVLVVLALLAVYVIRKTGIDNQLIDYIKRKR